MTETEHLKHLEVIQAAITRMAQNSFLLKSWAVTLVAALLAALGAKDADPRAALLAAAPAVVFWALDAYYLALERRFRRLYDAVCANKGAVEPFSLDTSRFVADEPVLKALVRPTVWPVYGMLLALIAAVTLR